MTDSLARTPPLPITRAHQASGPRARDATMFWFLAPAILVLGVLSFGPTLLTLYLSATDLHLAHPGSGALVGLAGYRTMLNDQYFWSSVRVTLVLIGLPVTLQMLLGLGMALLLHNNYPLVRLTRSLFIAPMVIPPIVAGLMWKVLYLPNLGGLNYLLSVFGIPGPDWLGTELMAIVAVTIVAVWEETPFVMLLVLAGLESLPTEPFEAATVDGASAWQRFLYITWPLIRPVLVVALIFRVISSLAIFPVIYVLTQGGPGRATEVLNFYAYTHGFHFLDVGYASTLSVALLVLIVGLSLGLVALRMRQSEAV